jgi:ribulose-phosphate 3-epimerase
MSVRIVPSILSADFARLADDIARIEEGGADWVHVDVMDGHFVPNLTFGVKVIETVRRITRLPLDVHLMVERPENFLESFAMAGASTLTIHVEVSPHLQRQLCRIKELGCMAGAALNPSTPLSTVSDVTEDLDLLLIMTVNPGFGGQSFIEHSVDKIARARALLDATGRKVVLEVDGGINRDTIGRVWRAGADTFVAGNAVFTASDPGAEIAALRQRCMETV